MNRKFHKELLTIFSRKVRAIFPTSFLLLLAVRRETYRHSADEQGVTVVDAFAHAAPQPPLSEIYFTDFTI